MPATLAVSPGPEDGPSNLIDCFALRTCTMQAMLTLSVSNRNIISAASSISDRWVSSKPSRIERYQAYSIICYLPSICALNNKPENPYRMKLFSN